MAILQLILFMIITHSVFAGTIQQIPSKFSVTLVNGRTFFQVDESGEVYFIGRKAGYSNVEIQEIFELSKRRELQNNILSTGLKLTGTILGVVFSKPTLGASLTLTFGGYQLANYVDEKNKNYEFINAQPGLLSGNFFFEANTYQLALDSLKKVLFAYEEYTKHRNNREKYYKRNTFFKLEKMQ